MAAALDLNIDALKYPDTDDVEKTKLSKPLSRLLKSKPKPTTSTITVPKEYLPDDYLVFLILRDFLQPSTTLSIHDAVNRIIEVFPDGYSNLRPINTVCIELLEQIPYHHPSQLKLARLLWLIGKNEKRIMNLGLKDTPAAVHSFYQHLLEDIVDNRGDPGDDEADPMRYVNYQAFLANLMDIGIWLSGPNNALSAMRGAFDSSEEGANEKENPGIREAWILGAAQWILWNGQGLFKLLLCPQAIQGVDPFELSDWQKWKNGFNEITDSEAVEEECKAVSRKAVAIMDGLEKGMSF